MTLGPKPSFVLWLAHAPQRSGRVERRCRRENGCSSLILNKHAHHGHHHSSASENGDRFSGSRPCFENGFWGNKNDVDEGFENGAWGNGIARAMYCQSEDVECPERVTSGVVRRCVQAVGWP